MPCPRSCSEPLVSCVEKFELLSSPINIIHAPCHSHGRKSYNSYVPSTCPLKNVCVCVPVWVGRYIQRVFSYPSVTNHFVWELKLALFFYNQVYSNGTAEAVGRGDVNAVSSLLRTVQEVHILVLWRRQQKE